MKTILLSIEETAFNWMLTHVPHILVVILIVWGAVYVTIKLMRLNFRFGKTEKQCDDLRDKYVPDLHKKISGIDGKINLVLLSVAKISTHLITAQGLAANIFESKSPMELTPTGLKILQEIGGKKYIDENVLLLISEIEKREPKSGLDVQNYSNIVLTEKTSEDGFIHIKNYIFQNPVYQLDGDKNLTLNLDIGMATQIMGIYLRNKYFDKYPDMKNDL